MSSLEKAIGIALQAHAGQVDKSGQPYILHPLRLMLKFEAEVERIIAVLHDVVEDSAVSLNDLRREGFPEEAVNAIECLSKRPGEDYQQFIARVSTDALATKIKIEDLKDNLDLTRIASISEGDLARTGKYHQALRFLLDKQHAL